MKWNKYRLVVAAAGLSVVCGSCGESDAHPDVLLGNYRFSGSMDMMVDNCTVANPTASWTTTLSARASEDFDRIWVTEETYGCSFLALLKGSIANADGLSCPIATAGFFREDFFRFRWDFAKKELNYSSVLYGQDATSVVVKYCASVRGSVTMQ